MEKRKIQEMINFFRKRVPLTSWPSWPPPIMGIMGAHDSIFGSQIREYPIKSYLIRSLFSGGSSFYWGVFLIVLEEGKFLALISMHMDP